MARAVDEKSDRHEAWAPHDHFPTTITSELREVKQQYGHGVHRPLAGYAGISLAYAGMVVALVEAGRRRQCQVPRRFGWDDIVLATVATAKLSRIIAKDPVTSPLRAPFTRFKGRAGEAELAEEVRGRGAQHAVGELLTCPFCVGQWVATAFVAGTVFAPDFTRLAALTGTLVAGADVLQYGFGGLQRAWSRGNKSR